MLSTPPALVHASPFILADSYHLPNRRGVYFHSVLEGPTGSICRLYIVIIHALKNFCQMETTVDPHAVKEVIGDFSTCVDACDHHHLQKQDPEPLLHKDASC